MPEKRRRMMLLGHDTEVTEVDIVEKVAERMAEYKLEEGQVNPVPLPRPVDHR